MLNALSLPRIIIIARPNQPASFIKYESRSQIDAALAKIPQDAEMFDIRSADMLDSVPNAVLLDLFNQLQSKLDPAWQPIPRFRDRATALRRSAQVITLTLGQTDAPAPAPASIPTPKGQENTMSENATTEAAPVDVEAVNASIAAAEAKLAEAEKSYKEFVAATKAEIKELKSKLKVKAPKTPREPKATGPSETVQKILALLGREGGATKTQIKEAVPEAKEGYINALLSRVLKEKGYKLESRSVEGQRERAYVLIG